jgi:LuxR family transcriptional regulator, maltose regulon positive regulatory protein
VVVERLAGATATAGPPLSGGLSDRQAEVLRYLPTMLTVGDIAAAMHISISTVKSHLRSIYSKLGVSRRRDAVFAAYERAAYSRSRTVPGGNS